MEPQSPPSENNPQRRSDLQGDVEVEIRWLDDQVRDAMLQGDVAALERICSEDFVVTNPFNRILNKEQTLDAVASGRIRHMSFERQIECLRMHEDTTAVVMGSETVVDTGPTVHRRYTEVWIKEGGYWLLLARHASLV